MILRTLPAANNAAKPLSPFPALLLTTVRSPTPDRNNASINPTG